MAPRRADLLIGASGAATGLALSFIWGGSLALSFISGDGLRTAAPVVVLGAALGASRRFPVATWVFAATLLLVTSARGSLPGGDAFAVYPLVAAHAFLAGRWDGNWGGVGGLIAFVVTGEASAGLAHDAVVPWLFIPATGWGAGRALRQREQVSRQLEERARELEEEREAYATLSVRYERARIASELHDIVAHAISVMVVQAAAGQRLAPHDPEATAETFEAISGAARQAEQDMGRLVALLGDEGAIGPAPDLTLVEELVSRASGSGLDVTLRLKGTREGLPAPVVEAIYRVIQEGLTNALRYAAGAPVRVVVDGRPQGVTVEVKNAAAGSEVALAGAGTGSGLIGLRERVGGCGGTLAAGPEPGGGWLLSAVIPTGEPRVAIHPRG